MDKLEAVENARNLMLEAREWPVWTWLTEKSRVRDAANQADDAFDELEKKIKQSWSEELKCAYRELEDADPDHEHSKKLDQAIEISPEIRALAKEIKTAYDAANEARVRAEETFAVAESRLNISMALDGTVQAIESWDLKEKAIRKAEAAAHTQAE
jgi:DNA repair ATPase RecN